MPLPRPLVTSLTILAVLCVIGLAIGLILGGNTGGRSKSKSFVATNNNNQNDTLIATPRDGGFQFGDATVAPTTLRPTLRPTRAPSQRPTNEPTEQPTPSPTTPEPTRRPTNNPTLEPTPLPTNAPIIKPPTLPPNYSFKLKLYWQNGYYWQEETFEKEWCLECIECSKLTSSPFAEGCTGRGTSDCQRGDQFWLDKCRPGNSNSNTRFQIVNSNNNGMNGDMIQVYNTNLCLERKESRYIALDRCDVNEIRQRWSGFKSNGAAFEWNPANSATCVSQDHHPKAREVLYCEDCGIAHKWDTGLWEAIN